MNLQIKKVIYYIEEHLDEAMDIVTLARVAGYSRFHFCRIFRLSTGESVMAYVARLRLERATRKIVAQKSVAEIGMEAGFCTSTGFLKAFKRRFGISPTAYRLIVQSRLKKYREKRIGEPEVVTREETDVVFMRVKGPYMESSKEAWEQLVIKMHVLKEQFSADPPKIKLHLVKGACDAIGICHDDPTVTHEENIRYDAALAWGKEEVKELARYGFETKRIVGGYYAKVSYRGVDRSEDAWYGLYSWLSDNGYMLRDVPPFEIYLNGATEPDMQKLEVEVYIPIEYR